MIGEAAMPRTRLVELPGRGTTRVWECAGPRCAQTLMLIHWVTFTAELNWAKVFAPLGRHFRVVAADLRGHGDGIRAGASLGYASRPALTIRTDNQPGAGAATFRKLADAGANADLLVPVRVSDDLFFAVICVDDPDKARRALGVQVISEDDLVL
jgi:pimeloyl-ACP methyl ester carboxylesterase